MAKKIQPFPVGATLYQITRGKNKGKWVTYGMEGVQNSLKRFANIPIYVLKINWGAINGKEQLSLKAFNTRQDAEEVAKVISEVESTIEEMILTEDQIVK